MRRAHVVKFALLLLTTAMVPGCIWWVDEGHRGEFHDRDHGEYHGDHHEDHHEDHGDHR